MTDKQAYRQILSKPGFEIFSEQSSIASYTDKIVVRSFNMKVGNLFEKTYEIADLDKAIDCFLKVYQYDIIGKDEQEVEIYEELRSESV